MKLIHFFSILATRSCHICLLCRLSGAGGARRDVLQQLLPLPAVTGGPERGDGSSLVGAEREADPRTSWQALQIAGSPPLGSKHTQSVRS
ncbi:hypothetical protein FKM82_003619 [Ascaphus truei]